jgi:predicted acetyltransferase
VRVGPPADRGEMDAFSDILTDSLAFPPRSQIDAIGRYQPGQIRLVRSQERVAGGLVLLPTGQYFGGQRVPMVGIHAVAIAPEDRGTGVGGELMRQAVLELARPGGPALSCLYPATQPIYRSVGFEQAGTFTRYRIPIDSLPRGRHDLPIERVALESVQATIGGLYQGYARRQSGFVERDGWFWRRQVDPLVAESRVTYAVREQERLTGYVILHRAWQGQLSHMRLDLHCREIVAETAAALRRILTLLGDDRSLGEAVFVTGPPAPADHLVLLEQSAEVEMQLRWMLRMVDVAAALAGRGYPAGLTSAIGFAVEDELVESNRGRFALEVAGGRGQVRRGTADREIAIDVRGLASLYSGYLSAEELTRLGMAAGPPEALAAATAIFAGPAPWLPEIF